MNGRVWGTLFVGASILSAGVWLRTDHPVTATRAPASAGGGSFTEDQRAEIALTRRQVTDEEIRRNVLPWTKVAVRKNGQNRFRVELFLGAKLRCNPGDMDALRFDTKRGERKDILLSVEPILLDDDSAKPVSHTATMDQLARGTRVAFDVQVNRLPAQLGLFLCRDDEKTERCARKDPADYMRVFADKARVEAGHDIGDARVGGAPPDAIYAFQYLFFDADGTVAAFHDYPVAKQSFEALASRRSELFPGREELAMRGLERARDLTAKLETATLQVKNGVFGLALPALDPKCPTLAQMAQREGNEGLKLILDNAAEGQKKAADTTKPQK